MASSPTATIPRSTPTPTRPRSSRRTWAPTTAASSTIHVELAEGWARSTRARGGTAAAYAREPFVRLLPAKQWPSVNDVAFTNFCDIALVVDAAFDPKRHLIIESAIDNLVKGTQVKQSNA